MYLKNKTFFNANLLGKYQIKYYNIEVMNLFKLDVNPRWNDDASPISYYPFTA